MAQERTSMRKIKEVLRLHFEAKISQAKIADITNISRFTVSQYIIRFAASGLTWPLPESIDDTELDLKLFPCKLAGDKRPEPDYNYLLQEIRKPDATLAVLWEEYKDLNPTGYQYSYFCDLFNAYRQKMNYSMKQEHKAGEKTFIDFGDSPIKIIDPHTGIETKTKIFVSVWGASQKMFAKSCFDEKLSTWIKLNGDALKFFGCCPKAMVPDNLLSAVTKASKYEPEINPTYAEFAQHYGTVIFPARPYKPKDKSLAENGVKLAKRWILFRLRNKQFYYLTELNQMIEELLKQFNQKPMRRFKKSRQDLFEQLDKPYALKLPDTDYEFAEWKKAKLQFNYHVAYNGHDYSVPYVFIGKELDIKATYNLIEIYCGGQRICTHARNNQAHGYTTVAEHMPKSHQKYLEWTPDRILKYAGKYGESVKAMVEQIMGTRKFPEQAYKSCLGIIRLENKYTADRLNKACQRAMAYRAYSYKSVAAILEKGLDREVNLPDSKQPIINHENIRGAEYYTGNKEAENNVYANHN